MIAIEISDSLREEIKEGGGETETVRTRANLVCLKEGVAVVAIEAEVKGEIGAVKVGKREVTGEEGERITGALEMETGQPQDKQHTSVLPRPFRHSGPLYLKFG